MVRKRFLECVHLRGDLIGERRLYSDGKRVSDHDYSIAWLEAYKAGKLGVPVTQSTGFGYRIITDKN